MGRNLSKRNVKLIVKILSDLKLVERRIYSNSFVCKTIVLKAHEYHKEPNLHTNSLNNIQLKIRKLKFNFY
jgi:hypothetical protein